MKAILLFFTLLVTFTFATEELRLLQFNETYTEWVPMSVVEKLICLPDVHFMDITDFSYDANVKPVEALPIPTAPRYVTYVNGILSSINVGRVTTTITSLSDFYTRYYRSDTGVAAARWLQAQYTALAANRPDITVVNFTTTTFPQASVIATIPGTGPNKDLIVILGGHLDSVGSSTTGRSPGADDDASGSASVLEVFRVLVAANHKPDFTLQFIGYAAEEGGLLGSQAIAADYQKNNKQVQAALQLDMTGYTSTGSPSVGIVTDFTSAELNGFVRQLVTTYTTLPQSNKQCGYACSDHASWNRTGVRSSFPFETVSNPSIHSANDLVDRLHAPQMLQFVRLAVGFAIEVGGVVTSQ
jgi:leucyl aminopeptidase